MIKQNEKKENIKGTKKLIEKESQNSSRCGQTCCGGSNDNKHKSREEN
jgi:hypothetical protein